MALSFVNQAQAGTSAVTMPTGIQAGDLMVLFGYRNTTTAPSLTSTWTSAATQSANSNSFRVQYKVAAGTESGTSITMTNANVIQAVVYRGVLKVGTVGQGTNASSATTTIPAVSPFTRLDTTSWVVTFAGHANTSTLGAITSTTQRGTLQTGTTSAAMVADTNGGVASFTARTSANGTTGVGSGASIELVADSQPTTTAISLSDNFDDNSTDAVKWPTTFNGSGNTLAETSQQLQISLGGTSQYSYYDTTSNTYNMTGKHVFIQVPTVFADALTSTQAYMKLYIDGTNFITVGKVGANLVLQSQVAGVDSNINVAYNTTNHLWWKIAEASAQVYWSSSPDGSTWTIQRIQNDPITMTALLLQIGAGTFAAQSPSSVAYDNFNVTSVNNYTQDLTGGLSFTGTMTKITTKVFPGGLSFTGILAKSTRRTVTAGLSFTGAIAKRVSRALSGGLSFVGTFTKGSLFIRGFTAGLSFTGAFVKTSRKSLTGGLSFTGSIAKFVQRPLSAGLSFTGSLVKRTSRALTGGLSFVGAFIGGALHKLSLSGSLSFTGSFSKRPGKNLTAGLSFTGAISKFTRRSLTAGLSFTGAIAKRLSRALTGGLSFTGALTKTAKKVMTGSLSFTGAIAKRIGKNLTAALSFTGALKKAVAKVLSGGLSFTGTIQRFISKQLASNLSFTGLLDVAKYVIPSIIGTVVGALQSAFRIGTASSPTDIATIDASANIKTVQSNKNTETIESDKNDTNLTSGTSSGTI